MHSIQYKQSSSVVFFIYSIIMFVILSTAAYQVWDSESNNEHINYLLFIPLRTYLYAVLMHEKRIPVFKADDTNIWLDCGLVKNRIKISKTQIINVEPYKLNGRFIKLIIRLSDGKRIDYTPPLNALFALEDIYLHIKNSREKT